MIEAHKNLYYVARDPEGHNWRIFVEIPLPEGWERISLSDHRFYAPNGALHNAGTMLKRYHPDPERRRDV